jgi:hypothetical protein
MKLSRPKSSVILTSIQEAVKNQGTNPYQIAKSSGLPLTTVQRLLSIKLNVPLRNAEMLLTVLGLEIEVVSSGKSKVPAATGRKDGKKRRQSRS